MEDEYGAEKITLEVLGQLERKRADLVDDESKTRAEVEAALVPIESAYREAELPAPYFEALKTEILATVPSAWRRIARRFTDKESREFGVWRGGDPVARLTYVASGLLVGGLIIWAPFIPIWEKWFPFVLAIAAYWLPDVQVAYHRRRYARALGRIAVEVGRTQPRLDATVTVKALLGDNKDSEKP
jgi:hypothetical protein